MLLGRLNTGRPSRRQHSKAPWDVLRTSSRSEGYCSSFASQERAGQIPAASPAAQMQPGDVVSCHVGGTASTLLHCMLYMLGQGRDNLASCRFCLLTVELPKQAMSGRENHIGGKFYVYPNATRKPCMCSITKQFRGQSRVLPATCFGSSAKFWTYRAHANCRNKANERRRGAQPPEPQPCNLTATARPDSSLDATLWGWKQH